MKLYALHSPAFKQFWDPFRESVEKKTSFELVAQEIPKEFDGAVFGQPVYYRLLRWLVEYRVNLVNTEKEVFATAGSDTEFYGDPVPDLQARIQDKDLIGADDSPGLQYPRVKGPSKLCSCLYVVRPGPQISALFEKVLADPRIGHDADDPVLNEHRDMVRWAALPHEMYWNLFHWHKPLPACWHMGDPVPDPPKEMLWFHANFCVGFDAKLFLLNEVRRKYACLHSPRPT